MVYKQEVQKQNRNKMNAIIEEYQIPFFIVEFLENNLQSENAKIQYWTSIKKFLLWCIYEGYIKVENIGKVKIDHLDKLKAIVFTRYFDSLKERNKMSTINTNIKQLKSFFSYLSYNDYITKDYIQGISKKKYKLNNSQKIKENKLPSEDDVFTLTYNISRIKNDFMRERNTAIVDLLLNTGLRLNELVGLNVEDVVIDGRKSYVSVISKGSYEEEEKEKVFLNKKGQESIARWLNIRNIQFDEQNKSLFVNRNGERLSEMTVYEMIKNYSEGLITPHMLRHYYGTQLYRKTKDIVKVKEQLRHRSVDTTTNFYVSSD